MKPFLLLALATGHLFEIPTKAIAEDRAKHMLESHPADFATLEAALADTVDYFEDSFQIEDWAKNNMNDILKDARLVRFTAPALDLNSAEWSFEDTPRIIPQIDPAQVLQMPVEMAMSAMAVYNNICQIVVLNDQSGKPNCAMVLIQGGQAIVGTYTGALQHLTNTFIAPAQPAASH